MEGRLPRASATRWNFHSRTVSKVRDNLGPIKACFEEIINQNRNVKVVRKASGFLSFLNGTHTEFWLELFHHILYHVNILFSIMQSSSVTACSIKNAIDNFTEHVKQIRESNLTANSSVEVQAEAMEICDWVVAGCQTRFEFTGHLLLAQLFREDFFKNKSQQEFNLILDIVPESYPDIDKYRLKNELEVYYKREEMHHEKLVDLLK